jgi:hypothetical protein
MQVVWERLPRGQDISAAQFEGLVRHPTDRLVAGVPKLADPRVGATPDSRRDLTLRWGR